MSGWGRAFPRRVGRALLVTALAAVALAASTAAARPKLAVEPVLSGYHLPVLVTHAPGGGRTIHIVEQDGVIKRARFRDGAWHKLGTFLDIRDRVIDPSQPHQAERGLLGLAFDPGYRRNGRFYVHYTRSGTFPDRGDIVVAGYRRSSAGTADRDSERILMVIDHEEFANHNGGNLAFGPDGLLYVGLGDGGGNGDPNDNGQDLGTWLGKILRIDPRDPDGSGPERYGIPPGNPFVGDPGLDEIWAYGTRNPWRYSFDRQNGNLWIGDVGEGQREEVDKARASGSGTGAGKGANLGWSACEGSIEFKPNPGAPCAVGKRPLYEYGHGEGRCSVTGGFVHRGPEAPRWRGLYVAADWCGLLFVLDQSGDLRLSKATSRRITSFGEDADGRLFATGDGRVYQVRMRGPRP
jgi:glucose/arabinose dehydrogenase